MSGENNVFVYHFSWLIMSNCSLVLHMKMHFTILVIDVSLTPYQFWLQTANGMYLEYEYDTPMWHPI